MTIYELLKSAEDVLKGKSKTYSLDCEILLSYILNKDKVYLLVHRDQRLRKNDKDKFLKLVDKRAEGTPIAYLTGKKEFYSEDFCVNKHVLIPRPETEDLVDLAYKDIEKLSRQKNSLKIVDVGTGSGNIGIILIKKILNTGLDKESRFTFYLSDISGKALRIAKKNLNQIIRDLRDIKVHFVKADLLKGIDTKLDIIISNPPYIPDEDIEYLDKTVKDFEPHIALKGGEGGIKIIKKLIKQAVKRLNTNGVLIFEMHENHPNIIKFFIREKYPDLSVKFYKDSFGMWRFCRVYSVS